MDHAEELGLWRAIGEVETVADDLDKRLAAVERRPRRAGGLLLVDAGWLALWALVFWWLAGFLTETRDLAPLATRPGGVECAGLGTADMVTKRGLDDISVATWRR